MFVEIILWIVACNLCLECMNNNYEAKLEWDRYSKKKKSMVFVFIPFLYLALVTVAAFKK